jgi:hypothetical protein
VAITAVAGATGCNAAVGGAVLVVLGGVTILGYSCGEPVDVAVWDRTIAHTVCDATVTAEQEGTVHEFSPCYRVYLGTGNWTITAKKPGYAPATGSVSISKERKCSEPTFHSVALTLHPLGEVQPAPPAIQPAPAAPPAPPAAPSAPSAPSDRAPPTGSSPTPVDSSTPKATLPPEPPSPASSTSGPAPAP